MQESIRPVHPLRDQLLQVMIDNKGSDMYITAGFPPAIKIAGEITRIDDGIEEFTPEDTKNFSFSLISEHQHKILERDKNLDFSFSYAGARFR